MGLLFSIFIQGNFGHLLIYLSFLIFLSTECLLPLNINFDKLLSEDELDTTITGESECQNNVKERQLKYPSVSQYFKRLFILRRRMFKYQTSVKVSLGLSHHIHDTFILITIKIL